MDYSRAILLAGNTVLSGIYEICNVFWYIKWMSWYRRVSAQV